MQPGRPRELAWGLVPKGHGTQEIGIAVTRMAAQARLSQVVVSS
jgi:hypothetical protein